MEVDRRLGAVLGSDSGSVGTSDGSGDRHVSSCTRRLHSSRLLSPAEAGQCLAALLQLLDTSSSPPRASTVAVPGAYVLQLVALV